METAIQNTERKCQSTKVQTEQHTPLPCRYYTVVMTTDHHFLIAKWVTEG